MPSPLSGITLCVSLRNSLFSDIDIDWVRNRISKEKMMLRISITLISSLSPYILKLRQEIFHLLFPDKLTCPCGLHLTCATPQWWLQMMVPPKIILDDTCFIYSITRSKITLEIPVDWVDWRCIECRPLKCTTWFNYQLDLELLRSLIRFILLLLSFTPSAWPWFIDNQFHWLDPPFGFFSKQQQFIH